MDLITILLAQSQPISTEPVSDTGPNPVLLLNEQLDQRLDIFNHPDHLMPVLAQIHLVWAVIFILVGIMCVLHGYRWHKSLIIVLAGLSGIWAGATLGAQIGDGVIVGACLAVLCAVLAWPLLKYAVALFGGLAGAFAGANIWTATGYPSDQHHLGALLGLVVAGMLAFLAFRAVVIVLTTVGGASLLLVGVLAAMLQVEAWRAGIESGISQNHLLIPIVAGSAALTGAVIQFGGGFRGMNKMANAAASNGKKEEK